MAYPKNGIKRDGTPAKKNGRPKGARNNPARATRWQPTKWKPIYDQVVLYHLAGKTNVEIAHETNLSAVHVGQILSAPQARDVTQQLVLKMQEGILSDIEQNLEVTAIKAVDRVKEFILDDKYWEAAPVAVFDRAMKILQGIGKLKSEAQGGTKIQNAVILTREHSDDLLDGLQEAQEVRQLHGGVTVNRKPGRSETESTARKAS